MESTETAVQMPSPDVAAPKVARKDVALFVALLATFAVARGAIFPFAENLYGDAVVRSELAERWAAEPHVITNFHDGAYQFGPLHFYYMGSLLKVWPSREHATRFASLLMSLLMVVPVWRIGRRLFSREAALVTGLSMAVWGLHIQASTTAASEALFMTLFLFALDYLFKSVDEQRFGPLAVSAIFVNLACMTRYDGWLYGPLLILAVFLCDKDKLAGAMRAIMFAGLCAPWPLYWMQQSEKATGDAFYAVHFIEKFHAGWVNESIAWMGQAGFRLSSLFFWPGTLLVTCSLLVGVFAIAGMVRAFKQKEKRALALLAIVPAAYYTFRATVLADFSPVARFAMVQVALSLFYVKDGFDWLCGKWSSGARRAAVALTGTLAIATPVFLGAFTAWQDGKYQDSLRPISPLSTIPTDQKAVADYIKDHVGADQAVIIDESPDYADVNVAFFTGLPEDRLARKRWENFEKQLNELQNIDWMFAAAGGSLTTKEGLAAGNEQLTWRGQRFQRVAQPSAKVFVYRKL